MAGQIEKAENTVDTIAPLLGNSDDVIKLRKWLSTKFSLRADYP